MLKSSEILQEFNKSELLEILQELGIVYEIHTMARDLIQSILNDLNESGLPDPLNEKECSELLYNFMWIAGYIDEDGNILNEEEEADNEIKKPVKEEQLPPCWGFEDDRDPSCNRCKLQDLCRQQKINTKPECFGRLYDMSAHECQMCLVASYCKIEFEGIQQKINLAI